MLDFVWFACSSIVYGFELLIFGGMLWTMGMIATDTDGSHKKLVNKILLGIEDDEVVDEALD